MSVPGVELSKTPVMIEPLSQKQADAASTAEKTEYRVVRRASKARGRNSVCS